MVIIISLGSPTANDSSINIHCHPGPLLLTQNRKVSILIDARISYYIHAKQWDVITHPCPNLNGILVYPPLPLEHE